MDSSDYGFLLILLFFYGIIVYIWFKGYYLPLCRNGGRHNIPESALNRNNAVLYVREGASENDEGHRSEVIIL